MDGISFSAFKSDFTLYSPGIDQNYIKVKCLYPNCKIMIMHLPFFER